MVIKALALPTLLLVMLSMFPLSVGSLKFVPIYKALTIRANKKLPPHIAFLDSHSEVQNSEWSAFEAKKKQALLSGVPSVSQQGPYVLTQKRVLEGLVIRKSPEIILAVGEKSYKTRAQAQQESEGPQWLKSIIRQPVAQGIDLKKEEASLLNLTAAKRITGHVELRDGLAVTNEHHIEIRRSDEGIFREIGKVDLAKGSYSIDVAEASGLILARLINKGGVVIGEGSTRLSQPQAQGRLISGPRLEIAPSPTWTGSVSSYYSQNKTEQTRITSLGGGNEHPVGSDGEFSFNNLTRGSSTVVRAEVEKHFNSNRIMIAGEDRFQMTSFPISMISALKGILTESKNPEKNLEETTVVWGTVTLDGKPLSGVRVISESDSEVKVIYFNEFMIPDAHLTETSSNGLYAFLDMQPGFNAILALRNGAYFGHQNVVVEPGTVSLGNIQNTLHTEPVRLRAYDAFAGVPVRMTANIQSIEEPLEIKEGSVSLVLPQVSRLSMIYTETDPTYIAANYFYNDRDSYIHLPAIPRGWLEDLKIAAKINEVPDTGTIVGFFGEENFEAFLAETAKNSSVNIIYFDASGREVPHHSGLSGGGFVIFNIPPAVHEVAVIGAESNRVFSKVVPVDANMTSVLNFTAY